MTESSSPERLQFGPEKIEYVPVASIVMLPQMRQTIERAALEELKDSLISKSRDKEDKTPLTSKDVSMNNAINLARLNREQAEQYLLNNAIYYKVPEQRRTTVNDIFFDETGHVHILIAGHRRDNSILELAQEYGNDINLVDVASTIFDGITFTDALPLQVRENTHDRPPAVNDAVSVQLHWEHLVRSGLKSTNAQVAKELGFKLSKVTDALAFMRLPDIIQKLAVDGALSYNVVKQLEPLARMYTEYYKALKADDIDEKVTEELVVLTQGMINSSINGNTDTKNAKIIEAKKSNVLEAIKSLTAEAAQLDMELFLMEPEAVETRVNRSTRVLKRDARGAIMHLARLGALESVDIEALEEALAIARSRQAIVLDDLASF